MTVIGGDTACARRAPFVEWFEPEIATWRVQFTRHFVAMRGCEFMALARLGAGRGSVVDQASSVAERGQNLAFELCSLLGLLYQSTSQHIMVRRQVWYRFIESGGMVGLTGLREKS